MHSGSFCRWRQAWTTLLVVAFCFLLVGGLRAAETLPAKPTRYFNDYALTVKPETAERLNATLENYEKQSSNQLLVAIYPKLQTNSELADYCQRVARSWQVGQKEQRNGAVLFVFVQERKTNIQVGYGLEGKLTDATSKDILQDRIKPYFQKGDYDGGLTAGVEAMIAATKGEYQGNGSTVNERENPRDNNPAGGIGFGVIALFILVPWLFSLMNRRRGGTTFGGGPVFFPIGLGGGGGSGSFGGGSGGGGGGGFSSGGGDFGGGGASGDW